MLLASLLVGTVLLFGSRKSGLYTVGDRERVQSGTIGTRVERAQLSRAANSQSKCVLAAGGGCTPRAQESKRAEGRESTWRERCAFSTFLKWTLGWHFSGTQRFFLVPLSRSLPLPPSRSLLLALYLLSLLNFHLGQVETCLEKNPKFDTLSQNAGGWDEDEDEEENNALSRKRSLLLDSKVLARPISLRRH